jgi:hypothetical protein
VPRETKQEIKIDEIRERPKIKEITSELESKAEILKISSSLVNEIKGYINTSKVIPKKIDIKDREDVNFAQEALATLQARVDRVLAVFVSCMKIEKALNNLELIAKQELARLNLIDNKTSGSAAKQLVGLILPDLVGHQYTWQIFKNLVQQVQSHLGEAKDTIRLQMKLDESANWSKRYGA